MKKKVPFTKEISFNTIEQINSISLDYNIEKIENNTINGNFIVSGDYKMTPASVHLDTFKHELPFTINIDKKYNIEKIKTDISDFYYEVVNNQVLLVNIEITIDDIEEIIVENDEEIKEERCIEKEEPIFSTLDQTENYATYKIHIITENDTIDTIINDYETSKDSLSNYNNLDDIKIGDKIIIPNENK